MSFSLAILALGLSTAVDARALSKKGMKWSSCPELNKNISELMVTVGPSEPFECGTLSVPLDYTDPDSPPLSLDLFRVKATKEPVLGTVLFNPGGPGGAAGDNFAPAASDLRSNVGEQYHLVSWDPRGTGKTIPFVCPAFGGESTSPSRKRDVEALPNINMTDFFLETGWDYSGDIAETCFGYANETGPLIGSAFVARDMLELVDALSEDGMLRYYGWSYGTALGSYFAAMFPDRVERMVLDGNIDPADYRDGTWGDTLHDTDKTFYAFLEACFENKEECALATYIDANSTQDLFNVTSLVIETAAVNITDMATFSAYSSLKAAILSANGLYFPSTWPALAEAMVLVLNTTADEAAANAEADTDATPEPARWTYDQAVSAGLGIRGADATFKPKSAEEYLPQVEFQANVSGFADSWYTAAWIASRWKMPAKERFYGEFKAKTKHPILYINGEYDPVTPLNNARRASKGFEGSVVLAHSGKGHGIFADPSTCVQKHVQAYFKDGVLPDEDAHCEPDLGVWELAKARNGTFLGALAPSE